MKNRGSHITINDIAEKVGVSKATVGRVLGGYGKVSKKTKRLVELAADEMNYQPNMIARSLRSDKTKTIAVVIGSIKNNYCTALVYAVEKMAKLKGYNVIICNTHEDLMKEVQHLKDLYGRKVDGIILMTTLKHNGNIPKEYIYLYTGRIPIVLVDRKIKQLEKDLIQSNNVESSFVATKYLLEMGHNKIGVIATADYSTIVERLEGYRKALNDYEIIYNADIVISAKDFSTKGSREATRELLNKFPDISALYLLNNSLCTGALIEIKERNIILPNDLSLLVWDDEDMNDLLDITAIVQKIDDIGRAATERLLELINMKDNSCKHYFREFDTNMILRKSCIPPKQ